MALLALAHAELGENVEAACVDHGLRPEARAECETVARYCEEGGIACAILAVEVPAGNLQQEARRARYRALGDWASDRGLAAIATAHHADDQAETVLMRLNRASGLPGLSGIRERHRIKECPVDIIRPLLECRKSELAALVAELGIAACADPSNADTRFDRVRIREALDRADWLDSASIARSAAHLAEAETTLEAIADKVWRDGAETGEDAVRIALTEWPDINARLLARAIGWFGGSPSYREVRACLVSLERRANLAGVLIEREGDALVCRPEPPRRTG